MQPFTVVIADSLTNDFMNPAPPFAGVGVNLGAEEIARLVGGEERKGPLIRFLEAVVAARRSGRPVGGVLVRDLHHPEDPAQQPELMRYGPHNLDGTPGAGFIAPVTPLLPDLELVETTTLAIPLEGLRGALTRLLGRDPLALDPAGREKVRFVLAGCHTDKRILGTAHLLRNVLEFPHVALSPHLVGSSNREAHFATLQGTLPDALVRVMPDLGELAAWAHLEVGEVGRWAAPGCRIGPAEVLAALDPDRRAIVEVALLRWSEATLTPLSGGFSGSGLFLAQGRRDGAATAPVVLKLDSHSRMQRELDGYHRVKELLGPAVPAFAPPISFGMSTGVVMELATREGSPATLQQLFEKARTERDLEAFLVRLERALGVLGERLYRQTLRQETLDPVAALGLADPRQGGWLVENLDHLVGHPGWRGGSIPLAEGIRVGDFTGALAGLVRRRGEEPGVTALVHGDLNLANLIADQLENLWVIDWTHSGRQPAILDFAKLENDVKFVISKDFTPASLPQLERLEGLLLAHPVPPPWEELPAALGDLGFDLRFQRILRSVRLIRLAARGVAGREHWDHYRLALLRYALHTLSFDARRGRGECEPPQLRYALLSAARLVGVLSGAGGEGSS